jgi:hypothetical protein
MIENPEPARLQSQGQGQGQDQDQVQDQDQEGNSKRQLQPACAAGRTACQPLSVASADSSRQAQITAS